MNAIAVPLTEQAELRRLVEFAADVADLAAERRDLDLHVLVDDLTDDLIRFNDEED
jgi:hypothetical protein